MDNPLQFMLFFTIATMIASSLWIMLAPQRIHIWGYYAFYGGIILFLVWVALVMFILIAWRITQ